jgi:hypothetical protein
VEPFWGLYQQHQKPEIREILSKYRIGTLKGAPQASTAVMEVWCHSFYSVMQLCCPSTPGRPANSDRAYPMAVWHARAAVVKVAGCLQLKACCWMHSPSRNASCSAHGVTWMMMPAQSVTSSAGNQDTIVSACPDLKVASSAPGTLSEHRYSSM